MKSSDRFPSDSTGLPSATSTESFTLGDGDRFDLRIAPVAKKLGDATVRMLAYNGSIPGPTLRVKQGTELVVQVVNDGDLEGTVHWHGLRVENRYDGTAQTQKPMPIGGSFSYRLKFPDPGVYWYHPHIREDYGQEMGLYGNIVVIPTEPDYWPPVDREITLALDDILLEDGRIAPFYRSSATYTAMGRYGNILLANGDPEFSLTARQGEVVRFYLTNTANTRVFNIGVRGTRMKLVGGDSGHYEREQFIERVLIAPSERAVVDVLFNKPGELQLEHQTPKKTSKVGSITVTEDKTTSPLAPGFETLRTNADMIAERQRFPLYLKADPDKTLALVAEMDIREPEIEQGATVTYVCPMHPDVIREEPARCPKCGMKLLATKATPITYGCPMHPDVRSDQPGRCPKCGMKLMRGSKQETAGSAHHSTESPDPHAHGHATVEHANAYLCPMHPDVTSDGPGKCSKCGMPLAAAETRAGADGIEWEDDMVEVNRTTTPANMRWKLIDRTTGAEGAGIDWEFRVGDRVKIRLINEMDSDHPMQHPFHIHGAGRFLILSRDGIVEPNLVWKDTVLVQTGQIVDLLLDVSNPGVWMAHCHIAEHHEGGMMFSFRVVP